MEGGRRKEEGGRRNFLEGTLPVFSSRRGISFQKEIFLELGPSKKMRLEKSLPRTCFEKE